MRVLHVYKTYLPEDITGIPSVIRTVADGMTRHGVESHVFAVYENATQLPARIGQHRVHRMQRSFQLASSSFSIQAMRNFKAVSASFDVINYHFPWPFADVLYFLKGRTKPSVITYHSDIVRQRRLLPFYKPLMNAFLNNAEAIVATSPDYVQTSDALHRRKAKVTVIPIGIEERASPTQENLERWRERVGAGFFLFVGAARYYKGLPFLIEAAKLTGLPVVIAGVGEPSALSHGQPLPDNVVCVGEVSDQDRECLLELCRAFVLPSHLRSEAFGVVLLEAARAGRPMISCEIGTGTSYVNIDGETGIVVPPADAAALAGAMRTLVRETGRSIRMGENARARFEAHFRADQMCRAYLALYRRVLENA